MAAAGLAPPADDPLFEPFIRTDSFGEGGRRISLFQSIRIAVLAVTLLPCRVLAALSCVAGYHLLLRVLYAIFPDGALLRRIAAFWGRFWSTTCLLALGFVRRRVVRVPRPASAPPPPPEDERPQWQVAIVSNHISWADILVHMSRTLPSFVAREGTQNIRMIGLIRWVGVFLSLYLSVTLAAAAAARGR
jgi:lysophosphatidylcholine acyltransferase/lyso-PAF acetyltransferase